MSPRDRKKGGAAKEVVISFAISVDEKASNEEIASKLEDAIGNLSDQVHNVSDLQVRTVPRMAALATGGGGGSGGYESRLWEKVTCDIFGGRLQNPGDPVELQEEIEQLSAATRELNQRVEKIARGSNR